MENKISTRSDVQNEESRMANNEISLNDIVAFLKRNRMLMVLWCVSGLLFAAIYVALMPKKYEARWQIQMAQFSTSTSTSNSVVSIEEPAALVQRLRSPTTYTIGVRQSCGVLEDGDYEDYLDGILKVDVVKNVTNSVEAKVRAPNPDQAMKCAEAITALITQQQHGLIDERQAGRQKQVLEYQKALTEEQRQLEGVKKSELSNFGYLAKLDKLSWLRTRIDALQEEAMLSNLHPARLIAPIYVPNKPVSPRVGLTLQVGLMLGLMLGVLYALGRERWRKAGKFDS